MTDFDWVAIAVAIWVGLVFFGCAFCGSATSWEDRRRIRRELEEWKGR